MSNLNTNLFTELFLYVPAGASEQFKQQYSKSNEYKSKIAFVEDTHEIFVNGKSFGYNYDEVLEEIWNAIRKNADDIVTINSNINLINTALSNEALVRDAKDTELKNYIDSKITSEHDRAVSKENNLSSSISTLESRVAAIERRIQYI